LTIEPQIALRTAVLHGLALSRAAVIPRPGTSPHGKGEAIFDAWREIKGLPNRSVLFCT
jgi:hypothetical protein